MLFKGNMGINYIDWQKTEKHMVGNLSLYNQKNTLQVATPLIQW